MEFEENRALLSLGENLGFVASYILFTTILYFLLVLLHKIESGNYSFVIALTVSITIIGILVRRWLK